MREFKKLPLELFIGYDIEQNSRVIELDASEMVEQYPSGILQLVCKRPGEETTYIAPSFEQDGGTLRWTLTSYDVEKAGQGLAIVALVDTSEESVKVLASHKIRTGIEEGLHFRDAERVDPEDSLIARVLAAVSQAQAYAQDAKEEADRAEAAGDAGSPVLYGREQTLTDAQQQTARGNIAAASAADVSDLKSAIDEVAKEASLEVTVSGEIAFFEDGSPKKPESVIIEIPYTSGGLSSLTMRFHHRNMLCLIQQATSAGVTYTPQSDGRIKISGTPTGNSRYGYYGSQAYLNANNIYNLPAGKYTAFGYIDTADQYSAGPFTIYKGGTTAQIKNVGGLSHFEVSESQLGRISNQWGSALVYDDFYKMFLGVGDDLSVDDWDAPMTTHHEVEATFGTTIYGGTADLTNGTLTSKYAADGAELPEPETIPITVTEIPTLFDGANTIWASVVGSVVTVKYTKNVQDYIDKNVATLQSQIDEIKNKDTADTERDFCSLAMFEKIGIIGDSYAMGSLYIPNGAGATYVGTYNNLSWGKNIQRLFGVNVAFYAHGGLSTRTWLTSADGMSKLESEAQTSACNLYWFGLGINDVGLYNSDNSYLGSIEDISGHTSGAEWQATFYGNVGQIIERIKAASPDSKIVIASFVGYRPNAQIAGDIALNDALKEIAEYYEIPFIDLKNDDFYISDFYTDNILGKHPVAMLYSGMALANARLLGKAVFDNQAYFKNYHMGTPAPDPEPDDPV